MGLERRNYKCVPISDTEWFQRDSWSCSVLHHSRAGLGNNCVRLVLLSKEIDLESVLEYLLVFRDFTVLDLSINTVLLQDTCQVVIFDIILYDSVVMNGSGVISKSSKFSKELAYCHFLPSNYLFK